VAEKFADGLVSQHELTLARKAAWSVPYPGGPDTFAHARTRGAAWNAVRNSIWEGTKMITEDEDCDLLREILGNPLRSMIIERAWLRWNGECVTKIAQGIYERSDFSRMPILADALEEAGCDQPEILAHCRGPDCHVKGCWVLDLLLGRG
jgi:hypothetical protein